MEKLKNSLEEADFLHGTQSTPVSGYVDFHRNNCCMSVNPMIKLKERVYSSENAAVNSAHNRVNKRGKTKEKAPKNLTFSSLLPSLISMIFIDSHIL